MKDTISRRVFIERVAVLCGIGAFSNVVSSVNVLANDKSERTYSVVGDEPLRVRAGRKGLIYGAAGFKRALSSDAQFSKIFSKECGMLVPEWELKWKALRPSPVEYNFNSFDWLIKFAQFNNILFRGHTLVWHEDLPQWFENEVNSKNAEKILLDHIHNVATRHAGKVHSWDVVNEAISPKEGRPDGLRNTPWLKLLGPDHIEIAFRAAAEADPKAMLVYNEYGLDYDTRDDESKRTAVLKLLERLKSKGCPVHALGIQAHLRGDEKLFNPNKLKDFLSKVANLDLKIIITEIDVSDQYLPANIEVRDRSIAGVYEDYLSAALDEKAVVAILTWGLSDKYSWLTKFKPRHDNVSVRPLPLDEQFNRKPAWYAIAQAFDNAPKRLLM